jgi:hypothetical protein
MRRALQETVTAPGGRTIGKTIADLTEGGCVHFTLVLEEQRG